MHGFGETRLSPGSEIGHSQKPYLIHAGLNTSFAPIVKGKSPWNTNNFDSRGDGIHGTQTLLRNLTIENQEFIDNFEAFVARRDVYKPTRFDWYEQTLQEHDSRKRLHELSSDSLGYGMLKTRSYAILDEEFDLMERQFSDLTFIRNRFWMHEMAIVKLALAFTYDCHDGWQGTFGRYLKAFNKTMDFEMKSRKGKRKAMCRRSPILPGNIQKSNSNLANLYGGATNPMHLMSLESYRTSSLETTEELGRVHEHNSVSFSCQMKPPTVPIIPTLAPASMYHNQRISADTTHASPTGHLVPEIHTAYLSPEIQYLVERRALYQSPGGRKKFFATALGHDRCTQQQQCEYELAMFKQLDQIVAQATAASNVAIPAAGMPVLALSSSDPIPYDAMPSNPCQHMQVIQSLQTTPALNVHAAPFIPQQLPFDSRPSSSEIPGPSRSSGTLRSTPRTSHSNAGDHAELVNNWLDALSDIG